MSAGIVIAAVVVLAGLVLVLSFNGLVRSRNHCDNAWAQIAVQLKRRHDLIPNLVETVKGYAAHERATFESVTEARANAISAGRGASPQQQAQAENVLTGALKSLFAVAEAYPQLKANQNYLGLQEELASTENRIASSRQSYNDSVLGYNTRTQTFPRTLIARPLHFTPREFFEAEPGAETPATVQF
jgi:Uncharacterized conserved protein